MAKVNQRKELGKGIRALLGNINEDLNDDELVIEESKSNASKKELSTAFVPLDSIEINPFQPRVNFDEEALEELATSIKIHGIIQPLTVRILNDHKYQLISGERRLRASKIAGLTEVPVFIRTANDQESLEMALLENIQREDLNAIEIGMNYQRLLDECNLSHEELSDRLGKKRSTITNYIRLLKLPPQVQIGVREDKISMGHARAIAGIEEVDRQLYVFNEIIHKGLSVRQTEELVASLSAKKTKKDGAKGGNKNELSPLHRKWQDALSSNLGTKVSIVNNDKGHGMISIQYFDQEELERIFDQIVK